MTHKLLVDEEAFKAIYWPHTDVNKVTEWRAVIHAYETAKQARNKESENG